MDIRMLEKKLAGISRMLEAALHQSGCLDTDDLLLVGYDTDSPNDVFMYETYMGIFSHLKEAYSVLSYLQKPVICEGIAEYSRNGYVPDGIELADEDMFEVLERDEYTGKWKWVLASICEYFETDYEGMRARVRGNGGLMEDMIYNGTLLFLIVWNVLRFIYWMIKCRKMEGVCESGACRFREYCLRCSRLIEKERIDELYRCIERWEREE